MAQYRRHRAAQWGRLPPILPLRLASIAAAGLLIPPSRFVVLATATVAGGLAFVLRLRMSAETTAWRRGAKGEQATARRLSASAAHGPSSTTWPSPAPVPMPTAMIPDAAGRGEV